MIQDKRVRLSTVNFDFVITLVTTAWEIVEFHMPHGAFTSWHAAMVHTFTFLFTIHS